MNIIPKVKNLVKDEGFIRINKIINIKYDKFDKFVSKVFLERTNYKEGENGILFNLVFNKKIQDEGYSIDINKKEITIESSSNNGVIYAFLTIYKLIKNDCLNFYKIEDYPDNKHRGLSFDCSRHFYSINEIKKIIDGLSLFKINRFHWHLSDDHGFRIESKVYPKLCLNDYYKQEEIIEIVKYAKERAIEIIPEIDMPGHVTAIINAYPELSCTGEKYEIPTGSGIFPALFCAGNENVFVFIENLLTEVSSLFPYKYFHIGGDECYKKTWENCDKCKDLMRTKQIESLNNLQGYFTNRVISILKKLNKEPIVWNETMLATNIETKPLFQYWTPTSYKIAKKAINEGFEWIYSSMYDLYFDYPNSMSNLKKVLKCKPYVGFKTINNGLIGYECCLWSEHIKTNERVEQLLFPRVIAVAEISWSGDRNYKKFKEKLIGEKHLLDKIGINYQKEDSWVLKGKNRHKETVEYFKIMNSTADKNSQTIEQNSFSFLNIFMFLTKFFKISDFPSVIRIVKKKQE